jgi:hypothetical protein
MITKKLFPKFQLIVGEKSVDLFDWFGVHELHGLTKKEAEEYPENKDDAYMWGLANYSPSKNDLPFIFLNKTRLKNDYTDATGIMHETMHLSLLLEDWNIEWKEEEIVSQAETMANDIVKYLKSKFFL